MHHDYLDKLAYSRGPIHSLDPRVKLGVAALLVLMIALTPPDEPWRLALFGALVAVGVAAARLPWLYLLRRSLLVLPFVVTVAALLPFRGGGHVLVEWQLLGQRLSITDEGLRLLLAAAARSYLTVWVVLLLASTTRFAGLLAALQAFGLPRLLVMQLSFLYRYLFVIAGEALRMRRARDARLAGSGPRGLRLRAAAGIAGVLFLRSYERSERVYQAMCARGFDGTIRLSTPLHLHAADWAALALGFTVVALAAWVPLGALT